MEPIRFTAVIEKYPNIDAAYIKFPFDVKKTFGTNGQVKVKAVFEESVEYRGSLANMGLGCHILGITKEIRGKINKSFGDTIRIEIEKDNEERIVKIPDDISILFENDQSAKAFFDSLSYTDRKEYIRWIESAKKEDTRVKRTAIFIEKLSANKKLSDK